VASNDAFAQIAAVELSTVANIATALTVLTAVVFGVIEMRRARKEREERAAFVAVQAILTPAWMESMSVVQAISDGTTPSQIEADPRLFQAVQSIACILESLGYAVFARMVPLNVVDELLGGTHCASPGANCTARSNTNVSAQVRKKIGNGFNGSPNRSTGIANPEPVSPSVRTRFIVTGGRDLDLAALAEC
jgi:hypothetical protein